MRLGAAIIGTGFMGPAHTEALRRLGVEVRGILGSSPEKSAKAAEALGLPRGYGSLEELLADGEVDAVHVTSPNRHHHAQVVACLEAGKHVLCEKPLAMTSAESADLVARAASSNRVCAVNYNVRFYPHCLEARERVRTGRIGEVLAVKGSYVQDWLLYPTDYNWRVLASEGGLLRAVADIGTHWLDLVQSVTGLEVSEVCADLATVHPERRRPRGEVETFSGKEGPQGETEPVAIETDDLGAVLVRFSNGARGVLWVSQVTAGRKNRLEFEISGTEGALAWDGEATNRLWIGHRNAPNELLEKDPSLLGPLARDYVGYPGGHDEGYNDSFKGCFRAFYRAVSGHAAPELATFADGHREILLCEAILASHRERRWVRVGGGE